MHGYNFRLFQYSNGFMNKQMQRKIKSSKIIFQNQKENTSGSDLQSLLVSSVRYDSQNIMSNAESQGPQGRSKPSQSLIKKQYISNVYIDEGNQGKCQACQKKLQMINQSLALVNLKLQEFESKLNICFGKYGKTQTRMGEIQLLIEQFRHIQQQNSIKVKDLSSNSIKNEQQLSFKLRQYGQQINRIKKITTRFQQKNTSERALFQTKRIQHKLQTFKDEQQYKIKQIVEMIEKVGSLQRKILDQSEKSDDTTLFLNQGPIKKRYFRTYSICQRNRTNESTNISYSRNYEFPK